MSGGRVYAVILRVVAVAPAVAVVEEADGDCMLGSGEGGACATSHDAASRTARDRERRFMRNTSLTGRCEAAFYTAQANCPQRRLFENSPSLSRVAVGDCDTKNRLGPFRGVDFECLLSLCSDVVSPQPDHFLGEFRCSFARVVRAVSKREMEVVFLQLQSIGHADIGQRPTAVARILLILGPVLQPDA